MKFCLSSRQSAEYLRKADEIRVDERDHRSVPDLAEKYPNADIVLIWRCSANNVITRENIIEYNILSKQKLIVCVDSLTPEMASFFGDNNIRYFWGYPVTTPYELQSIKEFFNVEYVRVDAPLFFQTDLLKKFGIPVRVTPNVAHYNYLPRENGINGTWIRPEDLHLYEDVFAAAEFEGVNLDQERALFRIYAEQKKWPGDLNYIITNIGTNGYVNRMLPEDFTKARLNCGQRCASMGACRLCFRYVHLADPERMRAYLEATKD